MIRINLLKPEAKEMKEGPALPGPEVRIKKAFPITGVVLGLIVVVLAAAYFWQKSMIQQERDLLAAAQTEKQKLQYVVAKLDELSQQKALFERKISLITQLRGQQETAVRILDEISRRLPDWVWLTDLNFDGQLIDIHGNALSNNLIADYIFNLRNCPHFVNVNLISSAQKTGVSTQYLEFALTLNYVLPQVARPAPAAAPAPATPRRANR
jgi:type IV pilus assembly protein PilN